MTREAGGSGALESLYLAEHGAMVRLAFVLTGSDDIANDIAHDAFLRIRDRLDDLANPGGYLRRIVVNLCHDHHRRSRRVRSVAEPPDELRWPPEVDDTWRAVLALPDAQREAVSLRFHADLPYAEIAEAMGCSVGTAKSNVSRGVAKLREVLDA